MNPYYNEAGMTIYHGDAIDVLPLVGRFDLCLTDPPYGVTYTSNSGGRRGKEPITNDGTRLSLTLYRRVVPLIDATHVLWFTRWDAWPDVWGILGHSLPVRGLLVWDKGNPGMGDLNHWGPSYELIASCGYGKTGGNRDQSILRFSGVNHRDRQHPTEKPVELLRYLISKMAPSTVLDPFMGSGSTLEAAKALGCHAVGIDIEERYCEISAKRLAQNVLPMDPAAPLSEDR